MRQDDRVVVHVHDARFRRGVLGYLMGVVSGRQPGPDIKKLPDTVVGAQLAHRVNQEPAGVPRDHRHERQQVQDLPPDFPVHREVVLTSHPVIPRS
jgi:hypothetical protein